MRVLLVAGAIPPIRCGVGDYTARLAASLGKRGRITPAILTASESAGDQNLKVFHSGTYGVSAFSFIATIVKFKPDIVHIQYPTMRPTSRYIPFICRWLLGKPVVQTWHEHFADCGSIGWRNFLGLNALVYVRPDFLERLPRAVNKILSKKQVTFLSNVSAIRPVKLDDQEREALRREISPLGKKIVIFFGFAYPNKGVHRLFDILDPKSHHLVIISDLHPDNAYQRSLIAKVEDPLWQGNVTVTGFLPEGEVSKYLAISDAVVFPFPDGLGEWNTSVLAALDAGAFVIGTSREQEKFGDDQERNIFLCSCDDIAGMRSALKSFAGRRVEPRNRDDAWANLASAHEKIYEELL